MSNHVETVVIGGGQAGLATGYQLARRGRPFVILDAHERVGDAWRTRWDSLRLFTPARFNSLPGYRFPASGWSFPSKDEMGDYLEAYAARFDLPVRNGVAVNRLSRTDGRFVVSAGDLRFEADNVVVATGAHRIPKVPAFASQLDPAIVQLHSCEYRGPSQLRDGDVLVVGAGNSGAEISFELAEETRRCVLAGRSKGEIPVRHGSVKGRPFFLLFRFVGHRVLTRRTPIGRKVGPKLAQGAPLIRRKEADLAAAGVERVPRVVGVRDGLPLLEDERVLDVANVVWCTGFRNDFGWIDLPVLDGDGEPRHERGVVASEPGLYFVGLVFQYSLSSDVLPSRGRDAEYIAKRIAERQSEREAVAAAPAFGTA